MSKTRPEAPVGRGRTKAPAGAELVNPEQVLYGTEPVAPVIAPKVVELQAQALPELSQVSTNEPELPVSLDKLLIPIANALPAPEYLQLHICSHKYDMDLREVMVEALKKYFKEKLTPKDKLPAKKQAKVDKKIQLEAERQRAKWE
jgi:hypothetical protein